MRFARDRASFRGRAACRPRSSTISSWSVAASAGLPPRGSIAARAAREARILILDNHDDFGGHAKRNEFMLDGRLVIGYGGSQSIHSPNAQWSDAGKGLLRELGVDVRRFETAFERNALFLARSVARRFSSRARRSVATCW